MAFLLAGALFLQMRKRRYVPWIYWLTVVLVSVVGTQITDALTDGMEISLYVSGGLIPNVAIFLQSFVDDPL